MAMGIIEDTLEHKLQKNQYGNDIVDEFIIRHGTGLSNRYITIFGLLYNCHSLEEVRDRLVEKDYGQKKIATLERYKSDSKTDIIDMITKSRPKLDNLREKVKAAYGKGTN